VRIQGVQLKGLRIPPGEHRLDLDAGYNVVLAGAAASALLQLLVSLLYPDVALGGAGDAAQREGPRDAQSAHGLAPDTALAILGLAGKSENYRIVADLGLGRVALARYAAGEQRYERIARDAESVGSRLRQLGLPELRSFLHLHVIDAPREAPSPELLAAPQVAPLARVSAAEPEPGAPVEDRIDEDEAKRLWSLRDRVERLALDLEAIGQELEAAPWLAPFAASRDFQRQAGRLRSLQDDREREQAELDGSRSALTAERERLASAPRGFGRPRRIAWVCAVASAGLGALLGGVAATLGYLLAGLSLLCAGALSLAASRAQRQLGVLDARLVALRVKEGSLESPLPADLQQLERVAAEHSLALDDLRRQVSDFRRLERRRQELRGELEAAQRELTPERRRQLEAFEAALRSRPSAAPPVAAAPPARPRPPRNPLAIDLAAARGVQPDQLVAEAATGARRSVLEVREALGPVLPLYLRALSSGRCNQLVWVEGEGCCAERDNGRVVSLGALDAAERARAILALRLALLEVLGPALRVPLLVGPGETPRGDGDAARLARALSRLGGAVQIVHFLDADAAPAWCAEVRCKPIAVRRES
jgi:hypothetical protein